MSYVKKKIIFLYEMPGVENRVRIVYSWSRILIFPDPESNNKKQVWEKICYLTFFVATKFHKIFYLIFLKRVQKKCKSIDKHLSI